MKFCKATQKKIQSQYWKYRAHIIILKQDKEQMIWHYIKSINKGSNKDTIGFSPLRLHTDRKSNADILSHKFQPVFSNENLTKHGKLTKLPRLSNKNWYPQTKLE